MSDAIKLYIHNYLRDGSAVGIVAFNTTAQILANMTVLSDDDVRKILSSVLPYTADGGTSILFGLQTCIKVCAELIYMYALENSMNFI